VTIPSSVSFFNAGLIINEKLVNDVKIKGEKNIHLFLLAFVKRKIILKPLVGLSE
jgi:hypothetical protein